MTKSSEKCAEEQLRDLELRSKLFESILETRESTIDSI